MFSACLRPVQRPGSGVLRGFGGRQPAGPVGGGVKKSSNVDMIDQLQWSTWRDQAFLYFSSI